MFRRNWRKNNNDKVLASNKISYQLHREERIAKSLEYQKRNFEKIRQIKSSYRDKNKEKIAAQDKERYLKNRDEILRKKAEKNKIRRNRIIPVNNDCVLLNKTVRKPSIDYFADYLNWEKNELEEIMSKIILRKCDKCGDMLAMRHFAGKSTTCRRCVDPIQYAVFLEKQKEKNERFYRNNPEKTRKQYYEDSKNNIEQNQKFDSEHFYMLFSRDNFEFNYWAKSNGIDLSFLPSLGDGQFLELIKKKDIEEQERKKELLKKYRSEKANDIKKYQREWYKNKNEINSHIPDVRNMVSSS